jgi:hypothetical protein
LLKITYILLKKFFKFFYLFLLGPTRPMWLGWTRPTCVAGLDLASPAWSLAYASDHPKKRIPLLGLEIGPLE